MILLIDALLAILYAGGLPGIHGAAAQTVGNAILLILAALAHFIVAIVRRVGIVLVLVNRVAQIVLLVVDLLPLLLRQMAVIGRPIVAHLAIQIGFARLDILRLACGHLPGIDAVGNAVLLILLALADGRRRLVGLGLALLSKGRSRGDQ